MNEKAENKQHFGGNKLSITDIPCSLHGRFFDRDSGLTYCKYDFQTICPARAPSRMPNEHSRYLCNYISVQEEQKPKDAKR